MDDGIINTPQHNGPSKCNNSTYTGGIGSIYKVGLKYYESQMFLTYLNHLKVVNVFTLFNLDRLYLVMTQYVPF